MKHLILLCLLFAGCQTVQQTSTAGTPLYTFRADMQMQIGGANFDGTGVWKLTGPVDITLKSPVAMDRLTITSCAREDVINNASTSYVYHYAPVHAELDGTCPLYVAAFSKDALTSWGFIGFRSDEALPSHADCNGAGYSYSGLTVCQTKHGLIQLMSFPTTVKAVAETACHMTSTDNQNFSFTPEIGVCRATFVSPDKRYHRLILLGYDTVLQRSK